MALSTFDTVNVHRGLPHFPKGTRRIVTTGTFDGVHLGHRALLDWMVQKAATENAESVVLTFNPHPRQVLFGEDSGLKLLQTLDQRILSLAETGLDHLVVQPFDRTFSRLKPTDFVRNVLVDGLGSTSVVVGHDHRFGAGREGDVELLRDCGEAYGFDVVHIPAQIEDELTVSSTKIRQRLLAGDCGGARLLLGRSYAWTGKVIHGDGRGRTLGFPTANLLPMDTHQLTPGAGVYAVRVRQEDAHDTTVWNGMAHLGHRPTFDDENALPTLEVHLFDASPDLYASTLSIQFEHRLRDVQKFNGAEALVAQLKLDADRARTHLKQRNEEPRR